MQVLQVTARRIEPALLLSGAIQRDLRPDGTAAPRVRDFIRAPGGAGWRPRPRNHAAWTAASRDDGEIPVSEIPDRCTVPRPEWTCRAIGSVQLPDLAGLEDAYNKLLAS